MATEATATQSEAHTMEKEAQSAQRTSRDSSRHSPLPEKEAEQSNSILPPPSTEVAVPPPAGPAQDEYLTTKQFIPVFICLYLALFLVALDRLIIATAIPTITNDFNSLGDLEWYASAYMLTASCFMLIFGRIYGFYSPKWVFMICILVFEIGSAVCGAAPNSKAFIFGRAIAGVGGAGAFSGAIIIIMFTVPMHKRPVYSGIMGSAFGLASAIGPLVGGAFTSSSATWRWCFYLNLPIGGAALLVILFVLPPIKTPTTGKKTFKEQLANLDPLGTALFLPSIVCLILALQWGGSTYAWNDGRIIALLTVFAVTFVAFIVVQWWKGDTATVPPRIIKNRTIAGAVVFIFFVGSSMMVIVYFLPVWFQAIQGVSPLESGIRTIPLVLGLVLFSLTSGFTVRYIGYFNPPMYLLCIVASVGAGMLTTLKPDSSEGMWIGYQVLYGSGLGMGMQQSNVAAQTVLSKKDISIGAALIFFAQQLGGSIFVAVAQNIFNQKLITGLSNIPGFDSAMVSGAGATDIRKLVPPQYLPEVLEIYNEALVGAFQVGLALVCFAIVGLVAMEWKSVKQEKQAAEKAKQAQEAKSADAKA